MGILIDKSDFVGDYELAKSGQDNINLFIEKYEKQILSQLLGSELLGLFQADLSIAKVPQAPLYLDLYNPFVKDMVGVNVEYIGLKEMVLAYVFFFYSRKNSVKSTMNGPVNNVTEVSEPANKFFLIGYYNRAIRAFKVVRYLCAYDNVVYPTYAGVNKDYASML